VTTASSDLFHGRTLDQWREAGQAQLNAQRLTAAYYERYYDGDHPLTYIPGEQRDVFRRLMQEARANWCQLVVNAVAERLQVVGFRFGDGPADDAAWLIWQASQMDADSEMAQLDALVTGHGYALVQQDEDNPTGVSITGEHPAEMTVLYAAGNRRKRVAAFKAFPTGSNRPDQVLILPDVIASWDAAGGDPTVEDNLLGLVPVVELRPQPRTIGAPRSELKSATSFQDRINTTIFNRLVATDFGAFRQKWVTGITLERDPDTGEPIAPFNVGADRFLTTEDPAVKFGEFAESTLAGYISSVEEDVKHLAAVTQTPAHYLISSQHNMPAESLIAAETGLVSKVRQRAAHIGEGWEEVIRLAFGVLGDPRAADVQCEVIWRDFESRSEGQTVDALVKMATLGVPQEVLWQRWGASPQEVERWKGMATVPVAAPVPPASAAAPLVAP
jgi:hypothetical protein